MSAGTILAIVFCVLIAVALIAVLLPPRKPPKE